MADPGARRYLAGTAYHCYRGNPLGMTLMHDRYPDKAIYETECASGMAPAPPAELAIAAARNWAQGVALWNLALDTAGGPKQGSGCAGCIAPVTIDRATGAAAYTSDYYGLGQASRFVRPGAVRIAATSFVPAYRAGPGYGVATVDDAAFANPDGSLALLVYNGARAGAAFTVRWAGRAFRYTLPAGAAATFTWATTARNPA